MKRFTSFLLTFLLCFVLASATAEESEFILDPGYEPHLMEELPEFRLRMEQLILDSGSTDSVSILDDVYTIKTAEGVTLVYQPVWGTYALTQDIKSQYYEYSLLFANPEKTARQFVNDQVHLFSYLLSHYQFLVYLESDSFWQKIGDTHRLSSLDQRLVLLQLEMGLQAKGRIFSTENMTYFLMERNNMLLACAAVGGHGIIVQIIPDSREITDGLYTYAEEQLSCLSATR